MHFGADGDIRESFSVSGRFFHAGRLMWREPMTPAGMSTSQPDAGALLGENFHVDVAVIDEDGVAHGNVVNEAIVIRTE